MVHLVGSQGWGTRCHGVSHAGSSTRNRSALPPENPVERLPGHATGRPAVAREGFDQVLDFDGGTAEVRAGISELPHQWLVITGEHGEIEFRDAPYTSWRDDETLLLLSDGRSTHRETFPAVDPYRLMVEEVSGALRGGTGWTLPLSESLATAVVLDAAFASARAGGESVAVDSDHTTG